MIVQDDLLKIAKTIGILDGVHEKRYLFTQEQIERMDAVLGEHTSEHRYKNKDNLHHYLYKHIYDVFLPKIEELLDFKFNKDDFYLCENIIDGEDYSYYLPKPGKNAYFSVWCPYIGNGCGYFMMDPFKINYNALCNGIKLYNEDELCARNYNVNTPYHRGFVFSHQTCIVTNMTCKNNRVLVVSCDSHIVPILPILCYCFSKVIILDNRLLKNVDYSSIYRDENVTDCLIALSESYPECKYMEDNFGYLKKHY